MDAATYLVNNNLDAVRIFFTEDIACALKLHFSADFGREREHLDGVYIKCDTKIICGLHLDIVRSRMKAKAAYHHGALRKALLAAAEKTLRRDGLAALTLRSIAREAGVSHGAPAHHFEDLAALLSDLAASGFQRLAEAMQAALEDPAQQRVGAARAYVAFALKNPALFSLMFREEYLDSSRQSLREGRASAFAILTSVSASPKASTLEQIGAMTATWCTVHGFAVLAIDKRLARLFRVAPPGTTTFDLLDAALADLAQYRETAK